MIEDAEKRALPVERISKLVYRIIQSNKPKARYIVYKYPIVIKMLRWLPARWVDKMVYRSIKE